MFCQAHSVLWLQYGKLTSLLLPTDGQVNHGQCSGLEEPEVSTVHHKKECYKLEYLRMLRIFEEAKVISECDFNTQLLELVFNI